jgi:hypothetical protein
MTIEADVFRRMAVKDSTYGSSNDPLNYIDPLTTFVGDHYIFCFCMLVVIGLVIYRLKSYKWFFQ